MIIKCGEMLKLTLLIGCLSVCGMCDLDFNYHKYAALSEVLRDFTFYYPRLSPKLYSIGKSVGNRSLWVVEVTAAPHTRVGIPNVKLIGNIHGNEAVGREILLHFLHFLGDSYGYDPTITWLMENTRLYILPSMNPDGFESSIEGICLGERGRGNSRNMDLNRNFPDFYVKSYQPLQPEVQSVQNWMKDVPFILSASLHGGALVVNYPFDTVKEMKWEKLLRQLMATNNPEEQQSLRDDYIASLPKNPSSLSADDDVFIHLAKVYANTHPTMHLGLSCPNSNKNFTGGITNGAAWYPFRGGMQDYNYFAHGCMELTLEISCCKYPAAEELPQLWNDNKHALLNFIKQAHMGVKGRVYDYKTAMPISSAKLKIVGRNMNFTTSDNGEFWRLLLPGTYELQVSAEGYYGETISFKVRDYNGTQPRLTTLGIPLINSSLLLSTTSSSTQLPTLDYSNSRSTQQFTLNSSLNLQHKNYSPQKQQRKKNVSNDFDDTESPAITLAVKSAGNKMVSNNMLLTPIVIILAYLTI